MKEERRQQQIHDYILKRDETRKCQIDKEITLQDVLLDPQYLKYFKLYATREFSIENIIFYQEIFQYKKMDESQRKIYAPILAKVFFSNEAIHEININGECTRQILENQKEGAIDLFDEVAKYLYFNNLCDIFSRFKWSDLFYEMTERLFEINEEDWQFRQNTSGFKKKLNQSKW